MSAIINFAGLNSKPTQDDKFVPMPPPIPVLFGASEYWETHYVDHDFSVNKIIHIIPFAVL